MPDNDERDPLEGWLSNEVRPLPPPPGTFELITRRARRRKLRRLTVTLGSAAAVAAAAAIAVPGVGLLHLTQPSATSAPLAAGSTPSASNGQRSQGTAGTRVTPAPSSASAGSTANAPPSGPVPANFAPVSVTFDSTDTGWVIGQAGTPGHCATKYCTSIARTNDAGQSWAGTPAPMTGAANGSAGVSGIRFLDGVSGWAFGPELWATHNSGRSWQPVSTGGQRVTDLETAGDRAYALFASCSGGGSGFAAGCTSYTLMTTSAGSDNWTAAGAATSGLTAAGGGSASAVIALTGSEGYLLAPNGTLYSGALGNAWQRAGTAPCQPGAAQANGQPSRALLALSNSTHLALACTGTSGVQVYTSSDSGATWNQQAAPAVSGTVTSLAATLSGTLVLAGTDGMQVLPAGGAQPTPGAGSPGPQQASASPSSSSSSSAASQAPAWQAAQGAPAGGFSYVGMTTDSQGIALPANAGLHEILMSFNGGLTWTAHPIS